MVLDQTHELLATIVTQPQFTAAFIRNPPPSPSELQYTPTVTGYATLPDHMEQ